MDELLASPHYGERWARHWLDLVRYGETSGLEGDGPIGNAWRYRDWVIGAFQSDMPYNKFVIQQLAGLAAEPVLVEPGRAGVLRAAEDAGLLVLGLSERWRSEGLGPVRSAIARAAPAPTLFVRRGTRPGALAPRGQQTRFAWSRV